MLIFIIETNMSNIYSLNYPEIPLPTDFCAVNKQSAIKKRLIR